MKKTVKILASVLSAILLALAMVACAPKSDPDKAVDALKKNGYEAVQDTTIIPATLKLLTGKNIDTVVSGSKVVKDQDGNRKVESVGIVYFATSEDANNAWDKMREYANEQNKDQNSDWQVKKSGKMIYWGTAAGIKAAS
ncbi:MAG: hypothetical protein E7680_02970 [Ruminococcaceae bacterium]|nr:hypothetical protein [Oscillospiraceae bacterium]